MVRNIPMKLRKTEDDKHALRGKAIPASVRNRNGECVVLYLVP